MAIIRAMRLADYRKQNGLTLAELGVMLGIRSPRTVQRYEAGHRFPPPAILLRIREATGGAVTADDFVNQHTAEAA